MMTTAADVHSDTLTCPPWCEDHSTDVDSGGPLAHLRVIRVGDVEVEVEAYVTPRQGESSEPVVQLPELTSLDSVKEVRDYVAALQQALDTLEGVGPDELVCERCAPHMDEAFQAGMRAGRSLAQGDSA